MKMTESKRTGEESGTSPVQTLYVSCMLVCSVVETELETLSVVILTIRLVRNVSMGPEATQWFLKEGIIM